ncbi:MAG TPA: hypothetical protein VHE79_11680 [Spirochaetia bacterium]
MPGLCDYRSFIDDLEDELGRIETILTRQDASGVPCARGCSACCRAFTVLPVEAFAIIDNPAFCAFDPPVPGACPFLTRDLACAIYTARPFLCRTRGFPVLHLNGDGDWERDSCSRRSYPPRGSGGLHLEDWNARLYRINEDFCREKGLSPHRVTLDEIRRAHAPRAGAYAALAGPAR